MNTLDRTMPQFDPDARTPLSTVLDLAEAGLPQTDPADRAMFTMLVAMARAELQQIYNTLHVCAHLDATAWQAAHEAAAQCDAEHVSKMH